MNLSIAVRNSVLLYLAVFTGLLIFTAPKLVWGVNLNLSSKSYMLLHEDARDNDYAPLYEYLELDVTDLEDGLISFHSGGWLRYDFRSITDEKRQVDELTYLYLTLSPYKNRDLTFDIGRCYVFRGVMSEQIDGLNAKWEITPYTGISLFGGVPVETENDSRSADYMFGGRIAQKIKDAAQVGLSYMKSDNDDESHREELGVDLWLSPIKWFEVDGISSYNNLDNEWMEHSYYLRVFPIDGLILSPLYSYVDYSSAFYNTTLSVFTPEYLGKDEAIEKIGGYAEYKITDWLKTQADYIHYSYDELGNSNYYGLKFLFDIFGMDSGIVFHRMAGNVKDIRYIEARAYVVRSFMNKFRVALDAINLNYDKEYNGLRNMYNLNGTVEYSVTDTLGLTASVDHAKTPDFSHKTTAFFKLVYNFDKNF